MRDSATQGFKTQSRKIRGLKLLHSLPSRAVTAYADLCT